MSGGEGENKTHSHGFVPSILIVAYRFGWEQGSEKLLLRLVKDAAHVGWHITVFAVSLQKGPGLEALRTLGVHISTDAAVLDQPGAFDLVCIHVCDMRLMHSAAGVQEFPLRFLICPTNSTAGIAGLRKPSQTALGSRHDASIQHLGVQRRSKSGCATMHDGPPTLLHPRGVTVDLVPMPCATYLLDELRGEFKGVIKIHLVVHSAQDYPLHNSQMVMLKVKLSGQEIMRSEARPVDATFAEEWDAEINCESTLEGDADLLVLTIVGLEQRSYGTPDTASRPPTSISRSSSTGHAWKEIPLASGDKPVSLNPLRARTANADFC